MVASQIILAALGLHSGCTGILAAHGLHSSYTGFSFLLHGACTVFARVYVLAALGLHSSCT